MGQVMLWSHVTRLVDGRQELTKIEKEKEKKERRGMVVMVTFILHRSNNVTQAHLELAL